MADNLALGSLSLLLAGLFALLSFLAGATCTSVMIRWARRRSLKSEYALPLILEAFLLFTFGFTGHVFENKEVLGTVALLCFTMGLQNAIVTKLSGAVIRTTHLTGMVTDVGIKLGRILYGHLSGTPPLADVDLVKLSLLASLIGLFFSGGVVGALGFRHMGFLFTVPLAVILLVLAALPAFDDLSNLKC
ncbi:putative transmembrane protein [Granulicella sibirica]|uniref:Putative transmembrane protein n=1 Tax=Granulicella sibirica TaxID=2479048 RepID=A0A4Q0T0K9_9BACT|nr:putative transmembrane protein [Granulicella sibirica]